ncbi:MAG: response regulator [bacterium]|nr:response regulator [bacterium]
MSDREVLIVDDDASAREALAAVLHEHGFAVHQTADGQEALKTLNKHRNIRVLLTDVRLPGMNGIELLAKVRVADPGVHVILVTAFAQRNLALRALKHGAADFLPKPVDAATLMRVVERSFYRSRLDKLAAIGKEALGKLKSRAILCSRDGTVLSVATDVAMLLGSDRALLTGKKLWQITGWSELKDLFERDITGPVVIPRDDFSVQIQRLELDPESDQVVLVITDITSLRQIQRDLLAVTQDIEARVSERTRFLSEEIEFSDRLLDTADVLIAYVNPDGRLERWNKFAADLTGLSFEEASNQISDFYRDRNSALAEIFDPYWEQEITSRVAPFPGPDGTLRLLTWSARRFREAPGRFGRLIIGMDVTEQKQLESTLQHYNAYLEDMVRQRSRELKTKNAQLIHTARLASLGEMVGSIAHEMKQPLNVIAITSDLIKLLRRNGKLNDELLENNLEKIRATVERMADTINHLRGFTHVDSTTFTRLTMHEVVVGAITLVGEQIRQEDIEIKVNLPLETDTFRGDRNQIEQVLINLLVNARDAILDAGNQISNEQRVIEIRSPEIESPNWLGIEVADSGTGMASDVVQHIFEPFYTTKDSSRGTGLGLSICLNIVRAHGGDIEVESSPGEGSIFRLLLPVDLEAELSQERR